MREHNISITSKCKEYDIEVSVTVDRVSYKKGSYSYHAESDMDYYGDFEVGYTIENVSWSNEGGVEFNDNLEDCPFEIDEGALYDKLCEKVWDDMHNPDY